MENTRAKNTRANDTLDLLGPELLDSHQKSKRRRIQAVAELIKKRIEVDYKKFLAELQYAGLRKVVAEEYLVALDEMELIVITGGKIIWRESLPPIEYVDSNFQS